MRIFLRMAMGLVDVIVMIIDETDVSKPVQRGGFWVYKLNSLVPD